MLAHCQIIVGTPDSYRLGAIMAMEAACVGELALIAQDIDEDAVSPL